MLPEKHRVTQWWGNRLLGHVSQYISLARLNKLREHTSSDPIFHQLSKMIIQGWPKHQTKLPAKLCQCFPHRDKLSIKDSIMMKCTIVFWPNMNRDIEWVTTSCSVCNNMKPHQQEEPFRLHTTPDLPWSNVTTYIFEWNGQHYPNRLLFWFRYEVFCFEIDLLCNITSTAVIIKLKNISQCMEVNTKSSQTTVGF